MSKILKQRRVFKNVEKIVWEDKQVISPQYNERDAIECQLYNSYYHTDKFKTVSIEIKRQVRVSHIEYQILCEHCNSRWWVRRKDARYCSSTCRKIAYVERQAKEAIKDDNTETS
jgi:hypothetical protein